MTNEESGDDSKKTPTEIIEPYLSSMDESVKEYMMSVVENFNDYEEEVTETTIRNLLEPLFSMNNLLDQLDIVTKKMTISINNIVHQKGDIRQVKELDQQVVMKSADEEEQRLQNQNEEEGIPPLFFRFFRKCRR